MKWKLYSLNINSKLLRQQIKALNESNLPIDIKEALHNLLADIFDQATKNFNLDADQEGEIIEWYKGTINDIDAVPKNDIEFYLEFEDE